MSKLKAVVFVLFLGALSAISLHQTGAAEVTPTQTLYLLGDSWTQQAADDFGTFDKVLADRGLADSVTIQSFAISGSTADEWANDNGNRLSNLIDSIKSDPLPNPVVFFTLGGNDIRDAFLSGPNPAAYTNVEADVRTIVNQLVMSRADTTIVIGGYDILNPAISPVCPPVLLALFQSTEPAVVNPYVIQLYDTVKIIADEFDTVTAVNTNGSLQGTPGMPQIDQWSSTDYIADCIHPNEQGYEIYLKTVFDQKLGSLLRQEASPTNYLILLPFALSE